MKPIALQIFLWLFTRLFYRVALFRAVNAPTTGGALLVSIGRRAGEQPAWRDDS